jgi:DNA polymerase elongation subunit (family B)
MNRIVFDIETVAYPLESFDAQQQEYLLKFAKTDEERADTIQRLSLHPLTAQVVAIGMLNPDSDQGKVVYQAPDEQPSFSADGKVELVPLTEAGMLEAFWTTITRYAQFITFNGRAFDCPFLMLRSALLGVRCTRSLLPNRYNTGEHCDLMDQFTFYGAMRKFNLDFYAKAFGITSPKSMGVTGLELGPMFHAGRYKEIAEYCMGDVRATAELFQRWRTYIALEK